MSTRIMTALVCDGCRTELVVDDVTEEGAVEAGKQEGWQTGLRTPHDLCPACAAAQAVPDQAPLVGRST